MRVSFLALLVFVASTDAAPAPSPRRMRERPSDLIGVHAGYVRDDVHKEEQTVLFRDGTVYYFAPGKPYARGTWRYYEPVALEREYLSVHLPHHPVVGERFFILWIRNSGWVVKPLEMLGE